ncbi:hypothetical protein BD413DRAFT_521531 [Trametes elegans]|nr:hypothetical protein BD413DRAFT_521531 [Trametes elegans]
MLVTLRAWQGNVGARPLLIPLLLSQKLASTPGALMRTGATAGITDRTYLSSSSRSPRGGQSALAYQKSAVPGYHAFKHPTLAWSVGGFAGSVRLLSSKHGVVRVIRQILETAD